MFLHGGECIRPTARILTPRAANVSSGPKCGPFTGPQKRSLQPHTPICAQLGSPDFGPGCGPILGPSRGSRFGPWNLLIIPTCTESLRLEVVAITSRTTLLHEFLVQQDIKNSALEKRNPCGSSPTHVLLHMIYYLTFERAAHVKKLTKASS